MKKVFTLHLVIILSMCFASNMIFAQETYHIIKVSGQIINASTGKALKEKTKIKSTDKVKFKSKSAKALIYSRSKGRFILRAKPIPGRRFNSELLTLVRRTIFAQRTGTYTRGVVRTKKDLIELFEVKKPLLLLGELELEFTPFSLNQMTNGKKGFFFVRFTYDGKTKNLSLKLIDGKKIILSQDGLFRTKEGLLDHNKVKEMIFSYAIPQEGGRYETLKLNEEKHLIFQPRLLSQVQLKENGIYNLAEYLSEIEKDEGTIIQELCKALSVYGTPAIMNVRDWYLKYFKK